MNNGFKHYYIPAVCPCCGEKICFVTDLEGEVVGLIPLKGVQEVMEHETEEVQEN